MWRYHQTGVKAEDFGGEIRLFYTSSDIICIVIIVFGGRIIVLGMKERVGAV